MVKWYDGSHTQIGDLKIKQKSHEEIEIIFAESVVELLLEDNKDIP